MATYIKNEAKPRINGSMLSQYQGHAVCLLGFAHDIDQNGISFKLKTSDNLDITIQTREPLQEYVEGLVEVHGIIGQRNIVICQNYVLFKDSGNNFDLDQYNTAIKIIMDHPHHYITL